jgi:hypothetical protein
VDKLISEITHPHQKPQAVLFVSQGAQKSDIALDRQRGNRGIHDLRMWTPACDRRYWQREQKCDDTDARLPHTDT